MDLSMFDVHDTEVVWMEIELMNVYQAFLSRIYIAWQNLDDHLVQMTNIG